MAQPQLDWVEGMGHSLAPWWEEGEQHLTASNSIKVRNLNPETSLHERTPAILWNRPSKWDHYLQLIPQVKPYVLSAVFLHIFGHIQ
ncbi:hypothetical protein Y1Q_0001067 [Alligator mississippiensis]|uniref:Uncharacterized protein n=1 Tax=Alligator mississippiensis TaxID=8496 RepID=A0A151NEF5_ALLMI|nr:hypothetical protein Y1Q_0001067 [Alligator mississippiensis]